MKDRAIMDLQVRLVDNGYVVRTLRAPDYTWVARTGEELLAIFDEHMPIDDPDKESRDA